MNGATETQGDRFARVAAGAVLFVPAVCWSFGFSEHFRFPKMVAGEGLAFVGALATLVAKWRWGGRPARWSDFAWDLTVAAAVVSLYMGTTHRLIGWQDIARLAAYSTAFALFRSVDDPWRLAPLVVLAASLNAGLALLQAAGLGLWESAREGRHVVYGTFGNPNLLAEYLMPVAILALAGTARAALPAPRIRRGAVLASLLVAAGLSGARAPWLGLVAGAAVLAAATWRAAPGADRSRLLAWSGGLALVAVVGGAAVLVTRGSAVPDPADPTGLTRQFMAEVAGHELRSHLWLGVGPGGYGLAYGRVAGELQAGGARPGYAGITMEAHRDLLQAAAERGLVGLAVLVLAAVLVAGAPRGWLTAGPDMAAAAGALACLGVEAHFGFPLHVVPTGILVMFLLAGLRPAVGRAGESPLGPPEGLRALGAAALLLVCVGRAAVAGAALGRGTEPALRAGLRALPTHGELHFRLGLGLVGAGRLDEAEQEFLAARPGFPDPDVLFNLGWIALQRKHYALSADRFKEGLRLYPFFKAPAWADYALALGGLGKRDEAVGAAQRALEIDAGLGRARVLLAELSSRKRSR